MEFQRRISCHSDAVLCTVPCLSGSLLASGGEDGRVCFTDVTSLETRGSLSLGQDVPTLALSPSRDHELFAAAGSTIYRLDLRKSLNEAAITGRASPGTEEINVLATDPAGNWLAAGDDSGEALLLDLGSWPVEAADSKHNHQGPPFRTLRRGHSNLITTLAWRPGGAAELVTGGADCLAVHWDVARLRQLSTVPTKLPGMDGPGPQQVNPPFVSAMAFVPRDRNTLAVGRGDGQVSLHVLGRRVPTATSRRQRSGAHAGAAAAVILPAQILPNTHSGAVTSLVYLAEASVTSPTTPVLVSGGIDGAMLLHSGPQLLERVQHGPKINHLQLLPGSTLAVADVSSHISLYAAR